MTESRTKQRSLFAAGFGGGFLSESLGIQTVVFVLGKLGLIAAVGFAHAMGNNISAAKHRSLPQYNLTSVEQGEDQANKKVIASYSKIAERNIFGAVKQVQTTEVLNTAPPPTTLKLRLVGTNVSSDTPPFAIIEDSTKKTQDVFDINEMVFEQAKLVAVQIDSVKLDHNGKIEILLIEDGSSGGSPASSEGIQSTNDEQTQFTVPEKDLEDALANLPLLLSQARAVPYFRNGKSIGMRLFAIRRGSLYEKLGMRNGDIVKAVNSSTLTDPAQALKLFEQLKTERSVAVKVERSGQDVDLSYSIE